MTAPSTYFINLSFTCNERCVFCAANLASGPQLVPARRHGVTLADVAGWLAQRPPQAGDEVHLAGGEPTLHKELLPIVGLVAQSGVTVALFTNGLRLASPGFARAVIEAGVSNIQIGLFGAAPRTHDAVTRRAGSFERTMEALGVLGELRRELDFALEVRLLVARQCAAENAAIVRAVHERVDGVDAFSLNRLILSSDAEDAGSAISWREAREPVNEAASLIRELGYELNFEGLPLCVYEDGNAEFVALALARRRAHGAGAALRRTMLYLDPYTAAGRAVADFTGGGRALPRACRACDYLPACGRVEDWYVARYQMAGIAPVRRALAYSA